MLALLLFLGRKAQMYAFVLAIPEAVGLHKPFFNQRLDTKIYSQADALPTPAG